MTTVFRGTGQRVPRARRIRGGSAIVASCAIACVGAACGDDDVPTVRGGERLAWRQYAPSIQELRIYQFRLYVNGQPAELLDARCASQVESGGYPCSGILPLLPDGQHVLQLTTLENGLESARSEPLLVRSGVQPVATSEPSAGPSPTESGASPACVSGAVVCFSLERVVDGLVSPDALSPTGDGRLLLIEGGEHVRVVAQGVLLPEPAYTRERPADRLIAIQAAADFATTRTVNLAWIEGPEGRSRTLTVARLRELRGRLGQRAVVLSNIPLPPMGEPQVTWDAWNRIYVAVPTAEPSLPAGAYDGLLLRFDADGSTPRSTAQVSPVLGSGQDWPLAMTVGDEPTPLLWLSGRARDGSVVLAATSVSAAGGAAFREPSAVVLGGSIEAPPEAVVSMTFVPGSGALPPSLFIVDETGGLHQATLAADGNWTQWDRVAFQWGTPTHVARGPADELYVTTKIRDTAPQFAIVRLLRSAQPKV